MDEPAPPASGTTAPARCLAAWRVLDDALRREVLDALDGPTGASDVAAWRQRLDDRAAVTDAALEGLRLHYRELSARAPATVDRKPARQ